MVSLVILAAFSYFPNYSSRKAVVRCEDCSLLLEGTQAGYSKIGTATEGIFYTFHGGM